MRSSANEWKALEHSHRAARPARRASERSRRRSRHHQLSSPPKTITFAITYIQRRRIAGPPSVRSVTLTSARRTKIRHHLERGLENDRTQDRAGQRLPDVDGRVRQPAVDGEQEYEHADERGGDRDGVGEGGAVRERAEVVLEHAHTERPDHEADEECGQDARHQSRRDPLPVQEAPVRQPVDDVERRLEGAEERQRRPEQEDAADDPERRSVVLHAADELDDAVVRGSREVVGQLLDEEGRRLGAVCEAEEREREEDEGHERQEREVRDHRREVGAAVGEELVHELAATDRHG